MVHPNVERLMEQPIRAHKVCGPPAVRSSVHHILLSDEGV
jgi:hypothetical protein